VIHIFMLYCRGCTGDDNMIIFACIQVLCTRGYVSNSFVYIAKSREFRKSLKRWFCPWLGNSENRTIDGR
jgi:hypothetical protein